MDCTVYLHSVSGQMSQKEIVSGRICKTTFLGTIKFVYEYQNKLSTITALKKILHTKYVGQSMVWLHTYY
jgi:transcriptional regulator of nitric oxide reductase